MANRTDSLVIEINSLRASIGLGEIEVFTLPGVWNDLVVRGFLDALYSRFLWLYSEIRVGGPAGALAMRVLGAAFEANGRRAADPTPQSAGRGFAQRVRAAVDQVRSLHGPNHPIYIDLIGHSRGGLAAHATALELHATHGLTADPNVHISFTAVDAIDTSGSFADMPAPLERPRAYAGELLNQFMPLVPIADRKTNLHAEYGLISGETSWFGEGVMDFIVNEVGSFTDEWIVLRGYPLGRARPELLNTTNHLVPGSSHTSIIETLVADFSNHAIGTPPANAYSLMATTYLGDLVQDPVRTYEPAPAGAVHEMLADLAPVRTPDNLLAADAAATGCEMIWAAQTMASDQEFRAAVPTELGHLLSEIDNTVTYGFPKSNAWTYDASMGIPTLQCEVAGQPDPAFKLMDGKAIVQTLDPGSMALDAIEFDVNAMLLTTASTLTLRVLGEGIDTTVPVTFPAGAEERFIATILVERQADGGCTACPDTVTMAGDGALVFDVSARALAGPIPGDLNADGAVDGADLGLLLGEWGNAVGPADLNADGVVDGADLGILLGSWSPA
jgi:hypothetical protein